MRQTLRGRSIDMNGIQDNMSAISENIIALIIRFRIYGAKSSEYLIYSILHKWSNSYERSFEIYTSLW